MGSRLPELAAALEPRLHELIRREGAAFPPEQEGADEAAAEAEPR